MHSLRTKVALLTVLITVMAVFVVTLTSVLFIREKEHDDNCQYGKKAQTEDVGWYFHINVLF